MIKPYVIGIAGGSASGKTTFSAALQKSLNNFNVLVIHMDSYFKPADERPYSEAPIKGTKYVDDNHPLTMDLPKLENDLADAISMGEYNVILVEGLLTLWDQIIVQQLDLKLFVECRSDERIVRRLKRNIERGKTFDEVADVYLDLVRYRHDEYVEPTKWRADFFINGSNSFDSVLSLITFYLGYTLKK